MGTDGWDGCYEMMTNGNGIKDRIGQDYLVTLRTQNREWEANVGVWKRKKKKVETRLVGRSFPQRTFT
jgi:hypothetical protein